jgi:Baseplate J-like protein
VALIQLELIADPDALAETGIRFLEDSIAGFEGRPGNVEVVLLYANAQIGAEIVEQASEIDPLIFSYFGEDLLGIAAHEATEATGSLTVTWAADVVAATLYPAGSMVAVPGPTGDAISFQTNVDLEAPAGGGDQTVAITALEAGEAGNGAYGDAEPIDIVDGVELLNVAVATAGGTEDETTDDYLARLAEALTILAPRPILPDDFATLARQVPGVGRATAIDLYQPSAAQGGYGQPRPNGPATDVPRCTTVVITAEDGAAPTDALMQEVYNLLDSSREVNFLVYVIPPGYDAIDVRATVRAYPGYMPDDVKASAELELANWLDPAAWGTPPGGFGGEWIFDNAVRLYEAVDVLNAGAGVHYVETVEIRKAGGTFGTADIPLQTPVGLPTPGTLEVTVTVPE